MSNFFLYKCERGYNFLPSQAPTPPLQKIDSYSCIVLSIRTYIFKIGVITRIGHRTFKFNMIKWFINRFAQALLDIFILCALVHKTTCHRSTLLSLMGTFASLMRQKIMCELINIRGQRYMIKLKCMRKKWGFNY